MKFKNPQPNSQHSTASHLTESTQTVQHPPSWCCVPLPCSHPEHREPAAGREPSSPQRSAPETEGAAPEAAGWAGGAGEADEGAAGSKWEQAEGAGDRAEGGSGSCHAFSLKLGPCGWAGLSAVELGVSVLFRHIELTPPEELGLFQALSRGLSGWWRRSCQLCGWCLGETPIFQERPIYSVAFGFLFSFSVRHICQTWGLPWRFTQVLLHYFYVCEDCSLPTM